MVNTNQTDNYKNSGTYTYAYTHTNITEIFQRNESTETDLVSKGNQK